MEIEKSVPIPRQNSKYPFAEMEIGDSVFFPGEKTTSKQVVYAYNLARKTGKKFSARTEGDGVRVWRVQ